MSGHWKPKRTSCSRLGARFGCLKAGLTKRASCSWVGGRLGSLKAGVMRGSASGSAVASCITGPGGGMAAASQGALGMIIIGSGNDLPSKMVPPSGIAFGAALAASLGK